MTTSNIGRNINILLLYCGFKKRRLYFTNSTSVHVVVIKNVALKSADLSATQDGCLLTTVRLDTFERQHLTIHQIKQRLVVFNRTVIGRDFLLRCRPKPRVSSLPPPPPCALSRPLSTLFLVLP